MLTKGKSRIFALILMVVIMATMLVGYASAVDTDTDSTISLYYSTPPYYWFWVEPDAKGCTDYATDRQKTVSGSYAFFDLSTVTNNSGYVAYIGACNYSVTGPVTSMKSVSGTGTYNASYTTGNGNVGTSYRPYGQTNSSAKSLAHMEGYWRP